MSSKPSVVVLLFTLAAAIGALALGDGLELENTFENRLENLDWAGYKAAFGKTYASKTEELDRLLVFLRSKEIIRKHNEKYAQGEATHWMSLNKFADMKPSEFKMLNGLNPKLASKTAQNSVKFSSIQSASQLALPREIDWRKMGYVTEIKDQGQCGSCWAFSATGALEGQIMRKTGKLVSLSEQNVVDCSSTPKYGNQGCNGGWMDTAFQYTIDNGALGLEKSYPYTAKDGTCLCPSTKLSVNATGFVDLDQGDEGQLKFAVATQGPIAVAIDATDFMYYQGGVLTSQYCQNGPYSLNHGVLAVGYGKDSKAGEFWIVKNSWGADWGEKGFVRMARNSKNTCGIATKASYPLL